MCAYGEDFVMISRKLGFVSITALCLAGGLGYGMRAFASGIPSTNALSYSGVLEDGSGPVNGSHNIQVILYDAATAGNNLCESLTAPVGVVDGHFSVLLPDKCTDAVGANANTWADVLVDGSDTGRTPIGAVPYAVEANRAASASGVLAQQIVPTGAVMFFNLAACPAGWSASTAANGRYLVGMPPSGTLAGTVGTALTNEENRAVGQHTHGVTDPGHGHGVSDPGHGHGVTDNGHAHGVAAGNQYLYWNTGTCTGDIGVVPTTATGACTDANGGTGSAKANVTIQGGTTGISVQTGATGIGVANSGSVAGTNAPYVQFLVCQKN